MVTVTPDKDCAMCQGEGHRIEGDTKLSCVCVYWKRVILKLGPEIATSKHITESPLYLPNVEHGGSPVTDKTKNNLLLKGWWGDLLSHFKWTFICKFNTLTLEGFSFQIITDEKLRNVWFGKESTQARTRKQRDEVATFNTVEDLIGGTYSLAIIRTGFLGWKNQAMGGILKEALMVRQALNLPTWLVEDPNSPFDETNYSWSRDVGDYVRDRFESIVIEGNAGPSAREGELANDDERAAVTAPNPVKPSPRPKPAEDRPVRREERLAVDDDPVLSGGGYKSSFKKRKSGGGPV